jgi:hypothetical protein
MMSLYSSIAVWYLTISLIMCFIMVMFIKVTDYLENKPKTNKFRQWWSNNMVDLDNKYSD